MVNRFMFFGGSRTAGRRASEATGIYIDRYPFGPSLLMLGIFLLNVMDAVFTLIHLQLGGEEFNPVAARFLEFGPQPFFLIKCGITAFCLIFLLMHVRFHYVRKVLGAVFCIYSGVFCYHIYLSSL